MSVVTRFAPSPTGPLHIGHAFSAIRAHDFARDAGGRFLLRIEDTDRARSRPQWEEAIYDDLAWLGLTWDGPVLRQSERDVAYQTALDKLAADGLLFPCSCSRADIHEAAAAPQEGVPTHGPDGEIYPGTCRGRAMAEYAPGDALRLDMGRAAEILGEVTFEETGDGAKGPQTYRADDLVRGIGDVVVARKSGDHAYHLASVVDDAAQGVTHVVRGLDLFEATVIHCVLQGLLGYEAPIYLHHRLIRDAHGKRLAKRDNAAGIAVYREAGEGPGDIRAMVGL
ncbi:MAG: tRNA glutamyl-Q(34) synthetase GluQRS [Pseudomonadota bacterium]